MDRSDSDVFSSLWWSVPAGWRSSARFAPASGGEAEERSLVLRPISTGLHQTTASERHRASGGAGALQTSRGLSLQSWSTSHTSSWQSHTHTHTESARGSRSLTITDLMSSDHQRPGWVCLHQWYSLGFRSLHTPDSSLSLSLSLWWYSVFSQRYICENQFRFRDLHTTSVFLCKELIHLYYNCFWSLYCMSGKYECGILRLLWCSVPFQNDLQF